MPKKKVEVPQGTSGSAINDLIEGTEFNFIKEGESKGSLSNKPKVETPIIALNDLLGGGLPLGAIVEIFGPNASGKSSMMYETLGNFQKQYPEGVAFIIDSEASTDDSRLRQLGVDPLRAPRMGASSLEDGFEQIVNILKKMAGDDRYKDFPVLIVWDTIAATPSRAQITTGDMYGGGMAERARIIKNSLANIFPLIENQNALIVLLNQVMAEIGGWKPGITSAGGNGLKHDVHMRIEVNGGKTNYDGVFATDKESKLSITKSKVSPIMNGIPISIDITRGGVIDRTKSFVWWMTLVNPTLFKSGAWFSLENWVYDRYRPYWDKIGGFYPRFRQKELYDRAATDSNLVDLLQLIWLDLISERYTLQKEVCKGLKSEVETRLRINLDISDEDFIIPEVDPETGEVLDSDLEELSSALSVSD